MTNPQQAINPALCPLCGTENNCMSHANGSSTENCWCNDKNIKFPSSLLEQVPAEAKRKACICSRCAAEYND